MIKAFWYIILLHLFLAIISMIMKMVSGWPIVVILPCTGMLMLKLIRKHSRLKIITFTRYILQNIVFRGTSDIMQLLIMITRVTRSILYSILTPPAHSKGIFVTTV